MNRKMIITTLALGTLALVIAFGAVAYRSASAQSATPTAPTTDSSAPAVKPGRGLGDGAGSAELASALGITEADLTAAYQKANTAAVAKAVELGLITQAQADQMNSAGTNAPFGGRHGGWFDQSAIDFNALLANALGISVEELQAAQTQANNARLDQAVTAGTITQEQADLMKGRNALYADASFQASMKTAFETAVAKAVADGVITQAQANLILKDAQGNVFGGMKGLDGPHGFGGFDGGRGHGGHGEWGGAAPTNPATPSVTP